VTDLEALKTTVSRVREDFGLDIMVNNAGITRDRTLKNMKVEDWEAVIRTNLTGVWNGCKAALPYVLEAGPAGRIISLSSTSYLGNFGQMNYAASKAGVVGLTRTLALEVARSGVTVNTIAPGFIDTAMTRASSERLAPCRWAVLASHPTGRAWPHSWPQTTRPTSLARCCSVRRLHHHRQPCVNAAAARVVLVCAYVPTRTTLAARRNYSWDRLPSSFVVD